MRNVCRRMERASLGARQLDLVFERVDNSVQTIRIGTAEPSRDANHLTRLLRERFEQVDPGSGVEAMRLIATTAEPHGIDTQAYLTNVLAKIADHPINRRSASLARHGIATDHTQRPHNIRGQWLTLTHLAAKALCDSMPKGSIDRYSTMDGIRRCQSRVV